MSVHTGGRRRLAALAAALLVLVLAAGCSSSGDQASDSASSDRGDAASSADTAGGGGAATDAAGAQATGPASGVDPDLAALSADRQFISIATLTVTVDALDQSVLRAERITESAGGLIFGEETIRGDAPQTVLTLKVPPSTFRSVLQELGELGVRGAQHQSTEDVTAQVVDLDSRIATSVASVDRLRALVIRAESIDDIVILESQLLERETTLEALRGEQRTLEDQVGLATITVTLQPTPESADTPREEPDELPGFLDSLEGGFGALLTVGSVLLVIAGGLLPWIPVAVVAALAIHYGRRWYRRRNPAPEPVAGATMGGGPPLPPPPPPAPVVPSASAPGQGQSLS